jgi:hypothetical protein
MILSGGEYGGYLLDVDTIKLDSVVIPIIYVSEKQFFIIDNNEDKWFYRIDEVINFIGINL